MEFEISDKPEHPMSDQGDGHVVRDNDLLRRRSAVSPEDYPDLEDRAVYIPEEGD